ncbi:YkgJ family cysteine cluster protein [Cohnella sp. CFH 77786]|uniref:YkgJ family cysteine cluster protein n=1 Tax=Cohnella sp. CFH 77786 TaxID=2662265 RepID=UPI001C6083FD|nr:YkgJ family cysteine cluster protein [Cohnella sp. CFH 77786]MBW5447044.1 YkgJ family cysteine cluster protein [Cohnella sp. CFH 77786]
MECRVGCAACCIAISISSPIPGMPKGKPAGVRCVQLNENNACKLFGQPERPAVCVSLQASVEMCGNDNEDAYRILTEWERATSPKASIFDQNLTEPAKAPLTRKRCTNT